MDGALMRFALKYVIEDRDRHGNVRRYLRMPGYKKVRLKGDPGSVEFAQSYSDAMMLAAPKEQTPNIATPDSLKGLCDEYYKTDAYKNLDQRTKYVRQLVLGRICAMIGKDGRAAGSRRWAEMTPEIVAALRDEPEGPEAGNGIVKALRQVFKATKKSNPADAVEYRLPDNPDGFHTWTTEEIAQFDARHPIGTKARLAKDLLLYSGVRRSDAVRLGKQMESAGGWHFVEWKGRGKKKTRKVRVLPILPVLRATIDKSPTGDLTYLVTEFGRPFTQAGFGNWFRRRCAEAKLPQCSAHGLRKAGAVAVAENGATVHQLCAIFGWLNIKQAQRYTEQANRNRLAREAMHLIVPLSDGESPTAENVKDISKIER